MTFRVCVCMFTCVCLSACLLFFWLVSNLPICGNQIVEKDEECDVGHNDTDPCCFSATKTVGVQCRLKPGKVCRYWTHTQMHTFQMCMKLDATSASRPLRTVSSLCVYNVHPSVPVRACAAVRTVGLSHSVRPVMRRPTVWERACVQASLHSVPNPAPRKISPSAVKEHASAWTGWGNHICHTTVLQYWSLPLPNNKAKYPAMLQSWSCQVIF